MLTGDEIYERIENGKISIIPFNEDQLNPNSYNLKLDNKLKRYIIHRDSSGNEVPLDVKRPNETETILIPDDGMVLYPGILYLGSTVEETSCEDLIPCIDGRSSIARLGINVHITAGFGDIGFKGHWTLEITVVHPVRIYPNMEICQIYFEEPTGNTWMKYDGKYQNQTLPEESRLYQEYKGSSSNS